MPGLSLTLRLTLLFALVSTAVLLGLGLLIGQAVEGHFEEQDMDLLTGKLVLTRHALAKVRTPADMDGLPQQLDDSLVGHHGLAIAIVDGDGRILFASSGVAFPEPLLASPVTEPPQPRIWQQAGRSFRGIVARLPSGSPLWPELRVAVATDISHHEMFMDSFRRTLWLFVAGAALLSGLLGWVAARRGLAPLSEIRRAAETVTASRLDYRLPLASIPAELAELAGTLNAMLARLEDSFRRLESFSGDLAHELRTPVSNLLTQTQVALSRARSDAEYREVLASNAEEFERLARMIGDMLFLAKADHGLVVPHRETVDLAADIRQLFLFYEALAEEGGIHLELQGQATVAGDRLMLRRALANLLANALRHSHRGGQVTVGLAGADPGWIEVAVSNSGDPIAPEHLPRLFDRFFRADPSRPRGAEGAGLGLAITDSIVRAHGGSIAVDSADGLTRFRLRLPVGAPAAGDGR